MEQSLEELRSSAAAKPKFSFKRKANKGKESIALTSSVKMDEKVSVTTDLDPSKSDTNAESTSNHISLSGLSDAYLSWSSLPSHTSDATDLAVSDLTRCVVNLLPDESANPGRAISALHVRNLVDTVLLLPRIEGSALLHDMKNCIIVLGCHQVRALSIKMLITRI